MAAVIQDGPLEAFRDRPLLRHHQLPGDVVDRRDVAGVERPSQPQRVGGDACKVTFPCGRRQFDTHNKWRATGTHQRPVRSTVVLTGRLSYPGVEPPKKWQLLICALQMLHPGTGTCTPSPEPTAARTK